MNPHDGFIPGYFQEQSTKYQGKLRKAILLMFLITVATTLVLAMLLQVQ